MLGSIPDLLRLVAIPVFGWAAYRDVKTRRVPNWTWTPLAVLAVVLLLWDAYTVWTAPTAVGQRLFFIRVAISLGFVIPLSYGFWLIGGFGGADAKAFMLVAVLFPVYPVYYLPTVALPLQQSAIGVFSLTILSNTVLAGIVYPLAVAAGNLVRGRFSLAMFIGRPVAAAAVTEEYGRLLESPDGFDRGGLDLDALRMYLRWRGCSLADIRADPDRHRLPTSLPAVPNDPGDGSLATDGGDPAADDVNGTSGRGDDSSLQTVTDRTDDIDDRWGAERFLNDIDHSAYGTSPDQLRDGLDVLAEQDEVWISPGIPFLVPMFAGLAVSLTYGDVLFSLLQAVGLA
ncbi:A24 family peptidase [Haloarcula sp. CBA1130]|uniref:A24 family peptidase n=1 Tax=unclassified Haloarcula TaxID=2624677 RepID=UPI001248EB4A|nr:MULTISPECIES: A24 family peptidase [unclassified Haloarcula]KAA9399564.1 A24 family peptidase [Haloarcula sp. CBA1129]KAA9401288.1 A24 family peptidase [Haloarcula sp. CBA1130]